MNLQKIPSISPMSIFTYPVCAPCYFKDSAVEKVSNGNYRRIVRRMKKNFKENAPISDCIICSEKTSSTCASYFFSKEENASEIGYCVEIFNNRPLAKNPAN